MLDVQKARVPTELLINGSILLLKIHFYLE